ncbi:hypothetical protein, partial [Pseudomonas aeruginosa]|uniref:hypothetical protein n=1 Tax=Pseudomonas aeruginosa TaxID=287 RepID=UPI000B15688D
CSIDGPSWLRDIQREDEYLLMTGSYRRYSISCSGLRAEAVPKIGSTRGEPGYYLAHGLVHGGRIIGVAVVKLFSVPALTSCFAFPGEFLLQASKRNQKTRPGILPLVPLRNDSARPPDGAGLPPHHLEGKPHFVHARNPIRRADNRK